MQIRGVIRRDVVSTRHRFQIDISPDILGLNADRQCLEESEILADLLLGYPLALGVRNVDGVGDLKCPDFRYESIARSELFEHLAAVSRVFDGVSRKAPRDGYRGVENEDRH